jgi:hypothetical protein
MQGGPDSHLATDTSGIRAALSLGEDHSGQQKAEGNPESAAQAAQRKGSLKS